MTARTRAVEDATEMSSGLYRCLRFSSDLRGIGWNPARYFELDGNCFLMEGFELGKKIISAKKQKGRHKVLHTPASFGQSLYAFLVRVTP